MRELERILQERGVVCDAREPDIVRVALVPLYNSFRDAAVFASELGRALQQMGRPNGA
jgi:kynureninase